MFEKIKVNILDSKKPSIVIVHKTSFPMTSIKLDGANYRVWSQIIEMHIAGKRNKRYCYAPYPAWARRGGAARLGLFNLLFGHWWTHLIYIIS